MLCELYGYDPNRFQWVRLGGPVNLGPAGSNSLVSVLVTPVTLAVDATALVVDVALLALAMVGAGAGSW